MRRAAGRSLPRRRRLERSPQLGHRDRHAPEPQAHAGPRPVGADRDLRQLRLGLPQQRRARRHHHPRPGDRRAGRARRPPRAREGRRARSSARWPCPGLHATAAFWGLDLDSELLFVGDAGTTEPSRPSRRRGIELTADYAPRPWLKLDASYAYSRARFTDDDPAGDRIPGAIEGVFAAGVAVHDLSRWSGSLRVRWFGPRPLIEDDSVRSESSTLVNADLAFALRPGWSIQASAFNLLDAEVVGHRLLLHVPAARRAARGSRRHPHPPVRAAHAPNRSRRLVLMSVAAGGCVPREDATVSDLPPTGRGRLGPGPAVCLHRHDGPL